MKKYVLVLLTWMIGWGTDVHAVSSDTYKYRVSLKDKAATAYSLQQPEKFLSAKSVERRTKQGLPVDSTDLPVCRQYVDAIQAEGVKVLVAGKWENFVTVSCSDTAVMERISALPFVRAVQKVWQGVYRSESQRDTVINRPLRMEHPYGVAAAQLQISNGHLLHQAGFKGKGMTIAVIDAGFHNLDRIKAMDNLSIEGVRDFVDPQSDIYAENSHGLSVLSCMAMNKPHIMIGTAPEASYWLLRSEDESSESLVEQDYWAAAIEFADSVGVDLVNTSLGYHSFDDASCNYRYRDLNGRYALMSRQASRAADKGMVVVCSAGNAGAGTWKKITPPADAENVIAVGAVDKQGDLAPFSSVGNTADGRVKPDVMAVGLAADIMGTDGNLRLANGTSFSSPILCGMVACLWQACPQLTAKEIIEVVRRSGNRADAPDNIFGYGIPDFWKAYLEVKGNKAGNN